MADASRRSGGGVGGVLLLALSKGEVCDGESFLIFSNEWAIFGDGVEHDQALSFAIPAPNDVSILPPPHPTEIGRVVLVDVAF